MTGSRPQPTEAVQSGWLRGSVSATDRADFSVVAIGASAGGLRASEADHDGMPRSAIATGAVDYILSAAGIAAVLVERERGEIIAPAPEQTSSQKSVQDLLPAIVDLLRGKTAHDFTFHKHGTLERGVERRMAMAAINSPNAYLEFLRHDPEELDQLARDLLINVTGFFRDSPVFDFLAKDVIPDLVRYHAQDRPLRNLERRLQFWRGNLFPRYVVARADRGIEARVQTADFRQRRRSGGGGERSRGTLSAFDRSRSVAKAIGQVFFAGRLLVPGLARSSLGRGLRGAQRSRRPAVRASGLRFLPERPDLSEARSPSQSPFRLPFCVARRRSFARGQFGNGRDGRRPICRGFQTRAPLSARRRQSPRRVPHVAERRRRFQNAPVRGACSSALAANRAVRALSYDGVGGLWSSRGADQP